MSHDPNAPVPGRVLGSLGIWLPILTSVTAAAWTLWVHVESNERDDRLRAEVASRDERTKANQASLEHGIEQLRTYGHQLDLMPRVIDLLKEESCPSDFLALTLLRETRSLLGGRESSMSPGDIGVAATKAAFRLLSIREDQATNKKPYCSCALLKSIRTDYVERGQEDSETAILAAAVVDQGAKKACQEAEAKSLESAVDLRGQAFSIVFVNSNDCTILKAGYKKARDAIEAIREDTSKVAIAAGHNGQVESQVVEFGNGTLSLEQASDLVSRLRRQPGIRDDIYWAHKLSFIDRASCVVP